jgi:predicted nucleic acid-binding protein
MRTITNTTVISNFACIGQLDLLRRLYGTLYLSIEVYEEVQAGLEEGYGFYASLDHHIFPVTKSGWIHLASMTGEHEFRSFLKFPSRLHKGEASSLAIAYHRGWLFLSDDLDARTIASRLGIRVSGSLGCLVLAVEQSLCSLVQANTWLDQMIQQGYHSPVSDLSSLL